MTVTVTMPIELQSRTMVIARVASFPVPLKATDIAPLPAVTMKDADESQTRSDQIE